MGISVALTPATTVVTVSKSMITNASFRTKKLPGESNAFHSTQLTSSTFLNLFLDVVLNSHCGSDTREENDHILRHSKTKGDENKLLGKKFRLDFGYGLKFYGKKRKNHDEKIKK